MKGSKRRIFLSVVALISVFITVQAIPQLVLDHSLSLFEALIAIIPVSILISAAILFQSKSSLARRIFFLLFCAFSSAVYVFLSSIVLFFTSGSTYVKVLILVPIDMMILAFPAYIMHRERRKANLDGLEYSEHYTSKLREILGSDFSDVHTVYVGDKIRRSVFSYTTTGDDWKVVINSGLISGLSEDEIIVAILSEYSKRITEKGRKLLIQITLLIIAYLDVLLSPEIIMPMIPAKYFPFLIILSLLGFIGLVSLAFQTIYLSNRLTQKADKVLLKYMGKLDTIISYIRKESEIKRPLRPVSQRQMDRFRARISMIASKRISMLYKYAATRSR